MSETNCPVCGGQSVISFLRQSRMPVHQNLVIKAEGPAREVPRGDIDMAVCDTCGFIFNRAFDMSLLAYGEGYDSNRACSPFFVAYMDAMIDDLIKNRGVTNCSIVEIGCGPGQFIRRLVSYPGAGNRGFGFDPSYIGPDSELDGRLQYRRTYYDQTCTDVAADVVICRHMIEHAPQPVEFLRLVRSAVKDGARMFFETPCIEWILRNRVMGDIYYEHCSMFSIDSFCTAFEQAGFEVVKAEHIFRDQYLWLEARAVPDAKEPPVRPHHLTELAQAYGHDEAAELKKWSALIADLRTKGGVALWGAGAKGVTFANLVDPDCTVIACAVDINPNRQGSFIPGTGHAIVAPEDLSARGVKSAILTNPIYREENQRLLAEAGIDVELVDWS